MNEAFLENLRSALYHLYDAEHLRKNPLVHMLGLEKRPNPATALQRVLLDAIAALEPDPALPSQAKPWRTYDILFCRYVQQLSARAVAIQLGLSTRHLRREQHTALETLASYLQEAHGLAQDSVWTPEAEASFPTDHQVPRVLAKELAWLRQPGAVPATDLKDTLDEILPLVNPLARQYNAMLDVQSVAELPRVAVHPVAVKQILLSLLSTAITWIKGGTVTVTLTPLRWDVEVHLTAQQLSREAKPLPQESLAELATTQQIAEVCNCRLDHSYEGCRLRATVTLPAYERLPVLIIDDNVDTLQLFKRYLSGSRYHFLGTRNPSEALRLAEQHAPQVIMLDVMMPQMDGWQLLGRLQQHPATRDIPIIVCTILAQERLALSLGAAAFLRKPITQEAFLTTLDQQLGKMGPESPSGP